MVVRMVVVCDRWPNWWRVPGARSRDNHLELERGTRTLGTALLLTSPVSSCSDGSGDGYKLQSEDRAHLSPGNTDNSHNPPTDKYFLEHSPSVAKPLKKLLQMLAEKRGSRKWKESNVSRASLCLTASYYKPTRLSFASLWVQNRVLQCSFW